jgi:hypothetical protein
MQLGYQVLKRDRAIPSDRHFARPISSTISSPRYTRPENKRTSVIRRKSQSPKKKIEAPADQKIPQQISEFASNRPCMLESEAAARS